MTEMGSTTAFDNEKEYVRRGKGGEEVGERERERDGERLGFF